MPPAASTADSGLQLVLGLYRSVLRLHARSLPPPLRAMGDAYARSEFEQHLRSGRTTPGQWREFGRGWNGYLLSLGGSPSIGAGAGEGGSAAAAEQDAALFAADHLASLLTPEQRLRMDALRKEAQALGQPPAREGEEEGQQHPDGSQGGGGSRGLG